MPSLRNAAREIFQSALDAANPLRLLMRNASLRGDRWCYRIGDRTVSWSLPPRGNSGRVLVFGAGKAAAFLARGVEQTLGDRVARGRIVVKRGHGLPLDRIAIEEGGHPLPDEAGQAATRRLLEDLEETGPRDRVFFLLTGGASALLVAPVEGLSLADKIETTRLLLSCGATIQEMNAIRKHLSAVKGGRLLEWIAPARVLTLAVSDVVGDDLAVIGSGPTFPDPSTFHDCLEILRRYALVDRVPASVRRHLHAGVEQHVPETPKPETGLAQRARHLIVASNRLSLDAAVARARSLDFEPEVFGRDIVGSTHEVARSFAAALVERQCRRAGQNIALIAGGETTLEVHGSGKGGRNQELALVAARELRGRSGLLLLAAGTDGTDGPTDAAGAFVDGSTLERAEAKGVDPNEALANNDAYPFFDALGDLLRTGPTGTNVMDLILGLTEDGGKRLPDSPPSEVTRSR